MNLIKLVFGIVFGWAVAWVIGMWPISQLQTQAVDKQMIGLSEQLLYAVKTEQPTDRIERQLATYSAADLIRNLGNDNARKTFWINLYNAYYQILAVRKNLKAPQIFTTEAIQFSDAAFSLDEVEHGILRRYRWKYSLGYLPQFFPGKLIKTLAVDTLDYRVHFALNCGAKSCPPIVFYTYDAIDNQLTKATKSFLKNETVVDLVKQTVAVSKIMQWFRGDFGGPKGIRSILSTYLDHDFSAYSLHYRTYDWNEALRNFGGLDQTPTP